MYILLCLCSSVIVLFVCERLIYRTLLLSHCDWMTDLHYYRTEEFARNGVPSNELQIYTWYVYINIVCGQRKECILRPLPHSFPPQFSPTPFIFTCM